MMTRSRISIANREVILRIVLVGLFIASSIYQIRFGANCDVALQVSWSSRTARGDFPLVDIWGPFCVSSWLVGFIYRVVYLFDEYFTYTFLILKILGVAIQTIISIYFYYVIRKRTNEKQAFWASVILMIFVPYYMYIFINHYNLSYYLTILLILSLVQMNQRKSRWNILIISGLIIFSILSMPTMVVMCPVVLVCIFMTSTDNKRMIIGILGCLLVVFLFGVGILYLHGGELHDILNLLNGGNGHGDGLIQMLYKRLRILIPLFVITALYDYLSRKIRIQINQFLLLVTILFVGTIGVWFATGEYSQLMRATFFSIIVLAMWSCMQYKKMVNTKEFIYFVVLGVTLGLICALSTNTGSMVASIGMVLPVAGYVAYHRSDCIEKSWNIATILIVALIFVQRICICDGWVNGNGFECTEKIESGVLKGIYVRPENAQKYNRIKRVVENNVQDDDVLLLYGDERTVCYGYLMTKAKNAGSMVDDVEDDFSSYKNYYAKHPDRIPTIIIIPGEEYIEEELDEDTDFVGWMKHNYKLINKEEGYLVLGLRE